MLSALKDLRIPQRSRKRGGGAIKTLRAQIAELHHVDQAIALLEWDEETYLPPGGREQRGEQTATLEAIRHNMLASDHFADVIEEAAQECEGDDDLIRELFLARRERRHALAVPEALVRRFVQAKARTLGAWEAARDKDEFAIFAGPFAELLELVRERAVCLSSGNDTYDALLDLHEPGMTRFRLEPLLSEMRERLIPLVQRATQATAGYATALAGRYFPADQQWALSRRMLSSIGFDFDRGRLDPTTHPFTMLVGRNDVRVTSRVNESDLSVNMLSTMHEGGHALYDQGFAASDMDTYLGDGPSMGLHEAQARLWENHVGRSRPFVEHFFPQLRELFPKSLDGLDAEKFWRALNRVRPGTIRTNADEMSYHLHIILRTELEIALLSGHLAVKDLMQAWNERSHALLGIEPATPREGVLQDVHWATGMFGYFPTYTIGSLYAAQLTEAYAKIRPLTEEIRGARFAGLSDWLEKNIYGVGNRFTAEETVIRATGTGLDTAAFFRHVESPERAWNSFQTQ